MDGGPKKHAAVRGLHSSSPYIVRMGSSANSPCVSSSPSSRPMRVTAPTMVMYIRVKGRMALYLVSVSDTADFFSASLAAAWTFFLPVAVFALDF